MGFIRDLYNRTENKIAEQFITNKINKFLSVIKKEDVAEGCDIAGEAFGTTLNNFIFTSINLLEKHTPAVSKLIVQNRDTLQQIQTLVESLNTESNKTLLRQIVNDVTTDVKEAFDKNESNLNELSKRYVKSFAKGFNVPTEPQYFIFESETSDVYVEVTPEHYQERQFANHMKFSCHYTTKSGLKTWEARPNDSIKTASNVTTTTNPAIKSASDIKL